MEDKHCPIFLAAMLSIDQSVASPQKVINVTKCWEGKCAWWDLGAKKCVIMCLPYLFNLTSIKKGRP